ncbi:transporter substrate-binding domain-containing protein [Photobacterium nomapromontoriensis]|uniref:transporter substrate-binding domain-containing protein n=1 Tax=Photobacterium nomapromontoriensis TaxID=2910237 RepID=UPI003D14FDE5
MTRLLLCILLLLPNIVWADSHNKTILKVGYPAFDWAPFSYVSEDGKVSGLLPALFDEMVKDSDFTIETHLYPNFSEVLQAIDNNEIDILVGVSSTYERQKNMAFSQPLMIIPMAAITRTSSLHNIHQLNDKLIALEQGFAIGEQFQQLAANKLQLVSFPTSNQAFIAVEHGTTDAYIGNAITLDEMQNHHNTEGKLHLNLLEDVPYERLYITAHKQQENIITELDKALDRLTPDALATIYNTWLSKNQQALLSHNNSLNLTDEESAWLEQRNRLKIAYHPSDYPFQFTDEDGKMAGLGADVLNQLTQQLDITMVPIVNANFNDILAQLDAGTLDAVAAVTCTPERLQILNCTQPYSQEKWVMVAPVSHNQDYINTQIRIGSVANQFGEILTTQLYSQNPIILYPDSKALLQAIENNEIDTAVISLASASQLLQGPLLGKLRVLASKVDRQAQPVGIAMSLHNSLLKDILNKAMAAVPPDQLISIKNKWNTVTLTSGISINQIALWAIGLIGLITVIIATFLYWTRKLNNEIRQRKSIEEKLTYLTNNFDGILLQHHQRSKDPEDIELLFVSDTITDLIGLPAQTLRDRPALIVDLLRQRNDSNWLFTEIRRAITRGYWQTELQLQSTGSQKQWIEIRSQILPLNNGWQWTSILIDISEMKKQQLELERARTLAESATEAKSRFLAMMSHEIRTPISGMMSLLELMEPYAKHQPNIGSIYTNLNHSAHNLLNIVNDVLDFSKIEAGKLTLSPVPSMLTELISTLVQPHVIHVQQKGLTFQLWQDPSVATQLYVDELRLKQVLNNLLNNASKFTEQGTISLLIDVVAQDDIHQTLRFTITDTGIGISEQDIGKLFQPFEQADVSTERRFNGTGLGLSICRQIVTLMGGEINVASTPQQGTSFSFSLVTKIITPANQPILDRRCGLVGRTLSNDIALPHYLSYWQCKTFNGEPNSVTELAKWVNQHQLDTVFISHHWMNQHCNDIAWDPLCSTIRVIVMSDAVMFSPEPMANGWIISAMPLLPCQLYHALVTHAESPLNVLHEHMEEPLLTISREQAIVRGQLLLVAEDHPINQQIIKQQLQRLGYYADIVDNGLLALEALDQQRYALLITDCHMPILDGYGLIKAIRQKQALIPASDSHPNFQLPVIMLTANTTTSETEYLDKHGFDAYLTKPVSIPVLAETLAHWLPSSPNEPSFTPDDIWDLGEFLPPANTDKAEPIDWAFDLPQSAPTVDDICISMHSDANINMPNGPIAIQQLISMFGEPSVCIEFMHQYLTSCQIDYSDLAIAVDNLDIEAVQQISHRMKGAAKMMAYHAMANHCETIEQMAMIGNIEHTTLPNTLSLITALQDQVEQL